MVVTDGVERAIQLLDSPLRLPEGAAQPVQGDHRLLRRARGRREAGDRGGPQRLPEQRHPGPVPPGPLPLPGRRRQVPDRLRRAAPAHHVRRQDALRASRRCRPSPGSTAPTRRSTTPSSSTSATTPKQSRHHSRPTTGPPILSGETDPNKLHDLKADLDASQVYADDEVEAIVQRFLGGEPRETLDPILDACAAVYVIGARRRCPGRLQGQGQSIHAHLCLPGRHPALHQRRVGEALDLPQPADPEAPRAEGGRPVAGHPGGDRPR